ncbi:MAG: hypothetical protein E4H02_05050 [Lentisphaerales bacterium]|jgi:hypothetical protein|nr:MAG: hypothetical protein E4H02_05050 [Lentisphaerales bacterium]
MHKCGLRHVLIISLAVACVVAIHQSMGQIRRPVRGGSAASGVKGSEGDASENLKIQTLSQSIQVRAPEYNIRNSEPSRKARSPDWGRVRVVYDSKPEWMNTLSCRFYVLMLTKDKDAETPYSLLEGDVTYTDVGDGKDHMSEMYLHPRTIAKLGDIVAVAIEITYGTETVWKSDESPQARLADGQWWKSQEIRNSDQVTLRSGLLLNRGETPFAYVNYWDFETIRR